MRADEISREHQLPDAGSADSVHVHAVERTNSSAIEVVSGLYAWNEDIAGAEIIVGKGKATPMAAAVQERLIRLWASPQGAPKAALAATTETPVLGPTRVLFSRMVSRRRAKHR
jgi:hypothetical protein